MGRTIARWLGVFLFVVLFTDTAGGQTTGGRIIGTVTDPSGAAVPGATVTLIQGGTDVRRPADTDQGGDYIFLTVPVGTYEVEYEARGFKKSVHKGVVVELNQTVRLDVTLEIGESNLVVEVSGGAPLVDTTSTQLGAVVEERSVTQLPLNSRDTYQLLQLQPGVQSQIGADLFYGSDRAGVVSVNGGRGRANNFTVNGGDGNDLFVNLPAVQPAPDTVQEFRVLTNTFDAEYGRNSGAVVNVVTKSGTNELHGNVYEFFRNKVLNARGYLDSAKPDLKQNQFGFTLGGPVVKDRTFFFGSYEGRRVRRGVPSDVVTVPTAAERMGDFSIGTMFAGTLTDTTVETILNGRSTCAADVAAAGGMPIVAGTLWSDIFVGNVIPTSCFDATAFDLLTQFVPLGNLSASEFQTTAPSTEDAGQFTMKIDHRISGAHQLTGYYFFSDNFLAKPFARFQAGGATVPGFGDLTDERYQQVNVAHTWTINPRTVNEFRFVFFRTGQDTFLHPQRNNLVQDSCANVAANLCFSDPANPALGITPGLGGDREGVPFIDVAGGFSIGNNFEGELPQVGNTFQFAESFSKVMGRHTTKFGADLRQQRFDQFLFFDVNGQFSFFGASPNTVGSDNLFPDYLLGLPDFYLQGSAQEERVRSNSIYVFGQDSWQIRPNVTLNYGFRWELNTPLTDAGKKVQTFRPGQDSAIYPCQLSAATIAAFQLLGVANPDCLNAGVLPRGLLVPGDQGIPGGLTQTYYRSFAPRIGLAWSPGWSDGWLGKLTGGPGQTSIRMGWGLFYNPIEQLVLEQFSAEPPFGGSSGLSNVMFNTPFLGQSGVVSPNPFGGILNPPRGQPVDWSRFRPILLFGQAQPDTRSQYSVQYNFTIQRQVAGDMVVQLGYVGTQGHRLLATHDINFGNPQTCLDLQAVADFYDPNIVGNPNANQTLFDTYSCGPFFADVPYFLPAGTMPAGFTLNLPYGSVASVTGPNPTDITLVGLRQFSSPLCEPTTGAGCPPDGVPVFSSIFAQDTIANSNYHGLQVLVDKRFGKGLLFKAAYTLSKSIDNASSFEGILDPFDFRKSRALSLFDARHRFVFSYVWELPVAKREGLAGKFVNGWSISGITSFQSGFPIRITSADDNELQGSFDFELPGQPDIIAPFRTQDPRRPGCEIGTGPTAGVGAPPCVPVENQYFDPNSFASQAFGTSGNAPRTICCGPGINNFDVGIQKNTPLNERTRLEFRAEFFNIWNHAQFTNPSGNITDGSDFGKVVRARDPRLIQFALKLFF